MSKKLIGGKYVKCTGICRHYLDMKKCNNFALEHVCGQFPNLDKILY